MDSVRYILCNIRGNWAEFRPEDPNAPGYPVVGGVCRITGLEHEPTLKVGFSGAFTRHLGEQTNERDFAPDRYGETALWLDGIVKIHAGCELTDFCKLVTLVGGDTWKNGAVLEALGFAEALKELVETNRQIGRHRDQSHVASDALDTKS